MQSNCVLSAVSGLYSWALNRGLVESHPAVRLRPPVKERPRQRVLTDAELAVLWHAWDAIGAPWGPAWQLLVLTGCRRGEVAGMRWDEIDRDWWTVRGSRTKTGAPHRVPLVPDALALLQAMPRLVGCPYVFTVTGRRPLVSWTRTVRRVRAATGIEDATIHDVRRVVRSGLARLGIPTDIAERVLGHTMDRLRSTYDVHTYDAEKHRALTTWSAHVSRIVTTAPAPALAIAATTARAS